MLTPRTEAIMRMVLVCGLVVLTGGMTAADDNLATKLLGKWELKQASAKSRILIEFVKDGKMSMTVEDSGKSKTAEGVYKLEGDKLTIALKTGAKDDTQRLTVKKVTDAELVTVDEKGEEETLRRVVPKK
jgi:uncharacterized protein (TIGR03066 family)